MTDSSTVMRNGPWMRGPFTVIPNACLQDYTLSLAAHAVLVRVLSLPPNWTFHKSWAQKQYGIGRDKLDSIIRELVKAEYVLFERTRNEDGTMGGSCFTFTAFKGVFHQGTEKAFVVEKTAENHTLKTPGHWKPAPTKNLKKELEKTYSADADARDAAADAPEPHSLPTETRTAAAAAGSPDADEGQGETRTGALSAPGSPIAGGKKTGASRVAGSNLDEIIRHGAYAGMTRHEANARHARQRGFAHA